MPLVPAKPRALCLICRGADGAYGGIVRDHDHHTGRIRGPLCHRCNVHLGILEKAPFHFWQRTQRIGKLRGIRWRRWVQEYSAEIVVHLQRDTGERYQRR